jgi:hypothetical protein
MRLIKKHQIINLIQLMLIEYFSPINLNYFLNFGSLAGICLILQLITGMPLNCEATLALCDSSISTVGTNSLSKELLPLDTLGVDNSYSSYFSFRNICISLGIFGLFWGLYLKYYRGNSNSNLNGDIIESTDDMDMVNMTNKYYNEAVNIVEILIKKLNTFLDIIQMGSKPSPEFLLSFKKVSICYLNRLFGTIRSEPYNGVKQSYEFKVQLRKLLLHQKEFESLPVENLTDEQISFYLEYWETLYKVIDLFTSI